MVKRRGLQKRLLITFSLIVTVVIILFSLLFFSYIIRDWSKKVESDLNNTAERMGMQIDTIIATMDYAAVDLMSQADFMPSLSVLAYLDRTDKQNAITINDAVFYLERSLYRYSLMRDFHRISIYTPNEDFFTNHLALSYNYRGIEEWFLNNEHFHPSGDGSRKFILILPFDDPWVTGTPTEVFALVRSILGLRDDVYTGFIEIQQDMDIIRKIAWQCEELHTQVIFKTASGDILYDNGKEADLKRSFHAQFVSDYSGITVYLARPKVQAAASQIKISLLFLLLIVSLLLIALLTIRYFIKQITKPVQDLIKHINSMEFESLDVEWQHGTLQDETAAMSYAFKVLQERLQESVNREIALQSLQLQTMFNSLQAQVDPHFLFNVLNVISSRGLETGNEEICEICDDIASLLRYSSSTYSTQALVVEEFEHVQNYLKLIKKRYEHKVLFQISIDPERFSFVYIPKIVLQPLVENCINHNLDKGYYPVSVSVSAGFRDDGSWFIVISDNGQGMSEERLQHLLQEIQEVRNHLDQQKASLHLDFGGLGVVNTFARLYLFFGEKLRFSVSSDQGVTITIEIQGDLS